MLSKTAIHAVRAVLRLAALEKGKYQGAASLAKAIGAPGNYLGKLLQTLARKGLLKSQRGLNGGFRLEVPASEISLMAVVQPIDQLEKWDRCVLGRPKCNDEEPCPLHSEWGPLRDRFLKLLEERTIADLLEGPHDLFEPVL